MSRIVDLSVAIEPHFRWPMERSLPLRLPDADGCPARVIAVEED